jgi:hypothetical protein
MEPLVWYMIMAVDYVYVKKGFLVDVISGFGESGIRRTRGHILFLHQKPRNLER